MKLLAAKHDEMGTGEEGEDARDAVSDGLTEQSERAGLGAGLGWARPGGTVVK